MTRKNLNENDNGMKTFVRGLEQIRLFDRLKVIIK